MRESFGLLRRRFRLAMGARTPSLLLLLAALLVLLPSSAAQFTPANSFLIDCGSASNTTFDGRVWDADVNSSPRLSALQHITGTSTLPSSDVPPSQLLHTARIFPSTSFYIFPVAPSRLWIRLYFFPFEYSSYDLNAAVFTVSANQYTLLVDVHVAALMQSSNSPYIFKEYSVNVTGGTLKVSFIPSNNSFAFINALEVVSMPSDIILDDSSPLTTNTPKPLGIANTALECIYRVNVGGPFVSASNDSRGLFRNWLPDSADLFSPSAAVRNVSTLQTSIIYSPDTPAYIAPSIVYSTALEMADSGTTANTFNISWLFTIDADFLYVVRLHFCEIVDSSGAERVFNVYLQNQTAISSLDLAMSFQADTVYYRDVTVNSSGGITSLSIDIGPTPNAGVKNNNAILNGIEIWKLNNSDGRLGGEISSQPPASGAGRNLLPVVAGVVGGGAFAVCLVVVLCLVYRRKSKVYKQPSPGWLPLRMHGGNSTSMSKMSTSSHKSGTGSYVSSSPSLGRSFTFPEIQEATNNFDEARVLGVGGFGKVYRGDLEDGTVVAVKRGNPRSEQGITEFLTEIEMLSKLRHRHLVSLIGYCDEQSEMILVYECMENGPLRSHLYGSDLPPLTWRQRLEICIGSARGLHYLHTGAAQGIIHRDVKTTNILLDENLVAKVADFGLSKTGPTLDRTHVSTAVKGSFGYLDPEYYRRQQLTEKSDVYSFGVVLMEVLCARPAINPALPRDQVNIAEWAMHYQNMGLLDQIIDPHLTGSINTESLKKFGETAEKCLAEQGIDRPAMGDVLWNLEYALQLQDTAMANDLDDDSRNRILELPVRLPSQQHWDVSAEQGNSLTSVQSGEESEEATASAVFSQLVKPQGR